MFPTAQSKWLNIKHNRIYIVMGEVLDANNSGDGSVEVLYTNPDEPGHFYRRKKEEFLQKFKPVMVTPWEADPNRKPWDERGWHPDDLGHG